MLLSVNKIPDLFSPRELEEIERKWPQGVPAQEVIGLFQGRGVKLSEATFRKYVQLGLLPTSRRVGSKGKHRGSKGVYPVSVVRRINLIKSMMAQDMTLEEIHDSFLAVQIGLEEAQISLDSLFNRMDDRVGRLKIQGHGIGKLAQQVAAGRRSMGDLMKKIEKVSSQLAIAGSPQFPTDQGG